MIWLLCVLYVVFLGRFSELSNSFCSQLADSLPSRVVAFGGLSHFTPENKPENVSFRHVSSLRAVVEFCCLKVADAKEYKSWAVEEEPAVDPFCVGKDISDDQMVLLEFRNHVRAMFHTCCNAAFPQKRILISGVRGTLEGEHEKLRLPRLFLTLQQVTCCQGG